MSTKFISTTGAGDGSGSSLANAINGNGATNSAGLRTAIQAASSGDVFKIVGDAGSYTFTDNGFTISVPLTITGVDSAGVDLTTGNYWVMQGTSGTTYNITSPTAISKNGISFAVSVDNITLNNTHIKLFRYNIYAENGKNRDITFSNFKSEICQDSITVKGDSAYVPGSGVSPGSANSQRWTGTNVTLQNFARNGFQIRYGCKTFNFTNTYVYGDGDAYTSCTVDASTDVITSVAHGLS